MHLKILLKKKLRVQEDLAIDRVKDPLFVDLKLMIEMNLLQIKEKNNPQLDNKLLVRLELVDLSLHKVQPMK